MQMRERFINAAKVQKKPIMGHFELTARCNLDCKMCYVHTQDNAEALRKELSTEQWKRIFDEAYDCEMLYATLSGGECLVRKDFKELYLYLWNKKVRITVMTNGVLLNCDYVEFFKTYQPDRIQISLYGSNEDGYLRITGHKGFEKAIAAISALKEAGIDVLATITANRYLYDDYLDILKLCHEKGFSVNTNTLLIPNREDPNKNDYYLTDEEMFLLSKSGAELKKTLVPVEVTPEPFGSMCGEPAYGLPCNAGNCLATITYDGKMYPCINAMVGGASLLEMSYAEAWEQTKKAAAEIQQSMECVGCAYDKTCPKCPAFRLKDLYSGHCNTAVCQMTRRLVAAGVKKLKPADE